MKSLTPRTKGILCIILSALGFSFMTLFVRISGDVPTMQKTFFRNIIAAIIMFFLLLFSEEKFRIKRASYGSIFARCLFGTAGMIANFYAVDHIPIADANMLNKLSPFFAIIASIFILKEIPSKIDILATVAAFAGAALVMHPTGDLSLIPALIGLFGGFGAGMAYTFVRRLGRIQERTEIIVFCFSVFSTLVSAPFLIFSYTPMDFFQLTFLILSGVCAAIAQIAITTAYRLAPAKELSVFDYTQVIFATLLGFFILGELPDIISFAGYAVIIGVALWRWNYLRRLP